MPTSPAFADSPGKRQTGAAALVGLMALSLFINYVDRVF